MGLRSQLKVQTNNIVNRSHYGGKLLIIQNGILDNFKNPQKLNELLFDLNWKSVNHSLIFSYAILKKINRELFQRYFS